MEGIRTHLPFIQKMPALRITGIWLANLRMSFALTKLPLVIIYRALGVGFGFIGRKLPTLGGLGLARGFFMKETSRNRGDCYFQNALSAI